MIRFAQCLVESVEGKRFLGGADLIRGGHQISLDVFRWARRQREHMVHDAVAFDSIEFEIVDGVAHGCAAMGEAMQSMGPFIPIVPIIQEVIVEQSGANQRMQVDTMP